MAIGAAETEGLAGTADHSELTDAQILRRAIRKSIHTSPEAFLKTVEEVDNCGAGYWKQEIVSATWAVIQQGEDVVGVAVAKQPNPKKDRDIDPSSTRFIESVWIDPDLRGSQLGERLVRFLFAVECARSPDIRQFLLWVFEKNDSAIQLYRRMGFVYDTEQELPDGSGRIECRYRYSLKSDAAVMAAVTEPRQQDLDDVQGLIYRVLGDRETLYSSPR